MQDENAELRLLSVGPHLLSRSLHVLLELLDGILQRRSGIVDLIHDQDALADQVLDLTQTAQVEPLRAGDLGSDLVYGAGARVCKIRHGQLLVQGETDSLDGNVGTAGLLEEGAQDSRGHIAATADGDYKLGSEGG